jgi:two-component system, NtrC family, sensor kinase
MLLHSRAGSGEHHPVDIIVGESLNLAYSGARAEKAGFNIDLHRDFAPDVGIADVYPQEITRVLLNLISNGFYAATKRNTEAGDGFDRRWQRRRGISATRSKFASVTMGPESRTG